VTSPCISLHLPVIQYHAGNPITIGGFQRRGDRKSLDGYLPMRNQSTSDGCVSSFTTLAEQRLSDTCNTQYEFSVDQFNIRGTNFDPQKLGAYEEGPKKEIGGYSKPIVQWSWELTPDDCRFRWRASGKIRAGAKGCLGRAIVSAGGNLASISASWLV
jgi:hypothetical protein